MRGDLKEAIRGLFSIHTERTLFNYPAPGTGKAHHGIIVAII